MSGITRRTASAWLLAVFALVLTLAPSPVVQADSRTDYLIGTLKKSKAFRVRAQAALSLGRMTPSKASKAALGDALKDKHPAVRIAALSSLGTLGDSSLLPLIKRATKDREPSVRQAAQRALAALEGGGKSNAEFYVSVAKLGSNAKGLSAASLSAARAFLTDRLSGLEQVELASNGETPAQVRKTLAKRKLRGFEVQTSVVSVEQTGASTRAAVSVILATYPGRDMRAMLRGAATVTGGDPTTRTDDAIQGALTGALRRLPAAMTASRPGT